MPCKGEWRRTSNDPAASLVDVICSKGEFGLEKDGRAALAFARFRGIASRSSADHPTLARPSVSSVTRSVPRSQLPLLLALPHEAGSAMVVASAGKSSDSTSCESSKTVGPIRSAMG